MKTLAVTVMSLFAAFCAASAQEPTPASNGAAATISIEGTGDSQELLRALAWHFGEFYPDAAVKVPDSIGSSGGVKAAAEGRAHLGRVARPLKDKEKQYGLKYIVFAVSPVVFAVNPGVKGVENITSKQIIDIYSGKTRNWKELGGGPASIFPVGRESGDSTREVLETHIRAFRDIKQVAKIFYTTPEAVEALVNHRNTIGYGPMAMVKHTNLKVLKVDGVYPSIENIEIGKYELTVPLALVYRGEPSPLAKAFMDFIFSSEGRDIVRYYGCIPSERAK